MAKLERAIEDTDGATLRRWYEQGQTLREAAAQAGMSYETVRTRILEAGGTLRADAIAGDTPTRPRRRHRRRPPDAELLDMYRTMSSLDIAARIGDGVTDGTVRGWLRQAGAPMRGPGRPNRPPEPAAGTVCAGPDCQGGDLVDAATVAERWADLGRPVTVDAVRWWIQASRRREHIRHAFPDPCQADPDRRRRHWADVLGWGIRAGKLPGWAEQASSRRWGQP